ncbi:MAG: 50S ribosomal protein L25 [Candidatus Zixiibacteriota bacterium]
MKELNLKVSKRENTGKGFNRRLRDEGIVPAVVYGPDAEPVPVQVDYRELYRLMHGQPMSTIINLDIEGIDEPDRKVLIRELQKDPVSGKLVHLDFHNISMDKLITITVAVYTVGVPEGVKNFGGVVQTILREIEVSCLPTAIPDNIEIDISHLNIGDSIHVSDLKLENVDILTDAVRTIVTISAPTVIKEVEAAEEEAVEGEEGAEGEGKEGEEKEGEDKKDEGDKKK